MSVIHCRRMGWATAPVVMLLFAWQFSPLRAQEQAASTTPAMERVGISDDGTRFVLAKTGATFAPWGFNFVGEFGRIVEEYWEDDWAGVEEDFRRMRALGANVVRLHLQVGTYMKTAGEVDQDALNLLRRTLDLAQQCGLYLDLTGLGCYHLDTMPPWWTNVPKQNAGRSKRAFGKRLREHVPAIRPYSATT